MMNLPRFLAVFLLPCLAFAQGGDSVTVRKHPVEQTFSADAVVEAVNQATVASQVAGRIVEVKADAGQKVRRGELLMRIDAREADEAARAAEAVVINARAQYERTSQLVARKFLSSAALDKARAELDAASAARDAASASRSHASIVAPLDGVVARRHAEAGDMAAPGKPLFTIYQPGKLRVTANVPQFRLKDLRSGGAARIEFPESGQWLNAAGLTVLPSADSSSHAAPVRASLPDGTTALPGMYARLHIVTGQAEMLTVPASAVVRRGEVAAVYVSTPQGGLSLRQLRLGSTVGDGEVEVLAGLADGEHVMRNGARAGLQVKSAGR